MTDTEQRPDSDAETTPVEQVFVVPDEGDGLRLDQCLATHLGGHSRAFYQKLIRQDDITLRGKACRRAETVHAGDEVRIRLTPAAPDVLVPQEVAFEILYEDDDILVINKPPGLVVHPAEGSRTGTLVHGLLFHDHESFADMADDNQRPGIVHRLDKDTSGVMVVARNEESRRLLKASFKEREVEKTYLALVMGEFGAVTGTIENEIGRNPRNRLKMAVVREGGKHALTRYRVLGTSQGCSLLEVRIFTGRTHQIRVHFSHLHHPILGDGLYGGDRADAPYRAERQLLHAWKLVFPHPRSGVMRQYMAPLPADFAAALAALGLPTMTAHPAALETAAPALSTDRDIAPPHRPPPLDLPPDDPDTAS
ncbi:MAG: RluA family pseudouridine synthase [Lentisphaerae bacterium]|nr:RluA family pseudouridine synthase [Lentisphaerota bacterium]